MSVPFTCPTCLRSCGLRAFARFFVGLFPGRAGDRGPFDCTTAANAASEVP